MKISEKYNFNIRTITPVHIGSGEEYLVSELIKEKNKYNRINLLKYFKSLENEDKQNKFIEDLCENNTIDAVSEDCIRYSFTLTSGADDFTNDNKINENIKVFNESYIPGSSIKGAIRTALLYKYFNDADINKLVVNDEINTSLINSYFQLDDDAKKDILKFLKISDSSTTKNLKVYKTSRARPRYSLDKKKNSKNKSKPKPNFKKGIPIYLESIYLTKDLLSFSITMNYDEKTYDLLNFDDKKIEMLKMDKILKAIYDFSNDLIVHEIKFCEKYNLPKLKKFYGNLKNKNDEKSPVLKIGYGSGLLATSLALKVKNSNSNLYKDIKKIILADLEKENNELDDKKDKKISKDDFPISRIIIEKNNEDMSMGWIKLESCDDNEV